MNLKHVSIHSFKGLDSIALDNCGTVNALVGRNNSGKSSILHAIDMAGLALGVNSWGQFQPKLDVKDLFSDVGNFAITLTYEDSSIVNITANPNYGPVKHPRPSEEQVFKSILIWPDVRAGALQRQSRTPRSIINQVEARTFAQVDSLRILFAIKYYALRCERGLEPDDYYGMLAEITRYFPEIQSVECDRTENDIATLSYTEYNRTLDILYSGSGLKHFIDVLVKTVVSGANIILLDEPEMGLHPDLQRRFITYLRQLTEDKGLQVFMATHSPILLSYADVLTYYRVVNHQGCRQVIPVSDDAIHTLLSDMGIRPSDVFNQDICLLVEGPSDVVFFEHLIRTLYMDEFEKIGLAVLQYGGSSADGIVSGSINVSNIVPAQNYIYWVRDRDAPPGQQPASNSTRFKHALESQGHRCHILERREMEFYLPESVLVAAQQGDQRREDAVRRILQGDQSRKFRDAASDHLRELLREHVQDATQIPEEIRLIVKDVLIPWKKEILGEE